MRGPPVDGAPAGVAAGVGASRGRRAFETCSCGSWVGARPPVLSGGDAMPRVIALFLTAYMISPPAPHSRLTSRAPGRRTPQASARGPERLIQSVSKD